MEENLTSIKKYIGSCCGNSFIILDCRNAEVDKQCKSAFSSKNIEKYGVDSALFISNIDGFDILIEIFEKDGSESDSCGNGIMLITYLLNLEKGKVKMKNSEVIIESNKEKLWLLMYLESSRVEKIEGEEKCLFVKMGEPHLIYSVDNLNEFDLVNVGEKQQKNYPSGINVDAIQQVNEHRYSIRTYERGVFAETKSCGTGSLSSFIAIPIFSDKIYEGPLQFDSAGGSHWISRMGNMLKLETLKTFCEIKNLN